MSFPLSFDILAGMGDPTDIEIRFSVQDANDWSADELINETVHIYPFGESEATVFTREPQPDDEVIWDEDGVTVTVTGFDPDDIWGYEMDLYVENESDRTVRVELDYVSVHTGFMLDPYWKR